MFELMNSTLPCVYCMRTSSPQLAPRAPRPALPRQCLDGACEKRHGPSRPTLLPKAYLGAHRPTSEAPSQCPDESGRMPRSLDTASQPQEARSAWDQHGSMLAIKCWIDGNEAIPDVRNYLMSGIIGTSRIKC